MDECFPLALSGVTWETARKWEIVPKRSTANGVPGVSGETAPEPVEVASCSLNDTATTLRKFDFSKFIYVNSFPQKILPLALDVGAFPRDSRRRLVCY